MIYYVYMLASQRNGTLYTGITNNILRRIYEHKNKEVLGFTKKYSVCSLVYFEETNDIHMAITREKQIKSWNRKRKIALIETNNPCWSDLSIDWENL